MCYTLPLFAAQNKATGETISLSRWAADVGMRSQDFTESENIVDRKYTIGSIGISKPKNRTLDYLYYGYPVRKPVATPCDGLSIDYVYPGADGQLPRTGRGYNIDYMMQTKTMTRVFHPMEKGFTDHFSVAVHFGQYDGFYPMMRSTWRAACSRLKEPVYQGDQELHYKNCMKSLTKLTRQYGDMDEALKNMPEVELRLNDNSVYNKKGVIESISGVIDRQTGTVVARVVFPNESRLLHSGASGTVVVPSIYKDCIAIPQTATVKMQDKTIVYKVVDGKAVSTLITVAENNDGREYVVLDGLKAGDEIVSEGAGLVREGTQVK